MQLSSIVHHKHDEKNYIENQSRQPSLNLTSSFGAEVDSLCGISLYR